ncbi:glycosyltransferase [Mycetocola zhadangensis]|uniref:glycosyltransferase n=1 Tax=Mycetocola zhadangensis TaxID=1164595 RepID=UPI003A4DBF59
MKILSVVTLITPQGDYGGPVRVALNQAKALSERGHSLTIAGAHRGYGEAPPISFEGIAAALFPARMVLPGTGFAGLAAPQLSDWIDSEINSFDIVHVHAARDLVTLPAARRVHRAGIPFVLQTHGMIDPSSNPLSRPLDAALTRPLLRNAKWVFYLTPQERNDLIAVGGNDLALRELPNGVPQTTERRDDATGREILYLARLAPRKRPLVFVEAARRLASKYPGARFSLVGPDEGEGARVERAIDESPATGLRWEGALAPEETGRRMSEASIYVLPSVDEPFPMSVLEAMAVGLPVIITESCGLAPLVRRTGSGIVTDESLEALVGAIDSLLASPELAQEMGRRGLEAARTELGMSAVAQVLEDAYSS